MNKVLSVLAVAAILGVSFYAGQKSFGSSVEYEHQDVIDAALKCKAGVEFTGKCMDCTPCTQAENKRTKNGRIYADKYKAGGCSYFKDTFCTLCTSIPNCKQKNTFCTTKSDQYCDKCEPGFFGPQCTPCKVCSDSEFVLEACVSRPKAPDSNTKCQKCTQCSSEYKWGNDGSWKKVAEGMGSQKERSYLTKKCNSGGNGVTKPGKWKTDPADGKASLDSQCKPCRVCRDGFEYTDATCKSPKNLKIIADFIKSIQTVGADTKCTRCTGCMAAEHPKRQALYNEANAGLETALYATAECKDTKVTDTKSEFKGLFVAAKGFATCKACKKCKTGQYISQTCNPGHPHKEWLCKKIVGGREMPGTKPCDIVIDKDKTSDTYNQPKIKAGEILAKEIPMSLGHDAECKDCTPRPANHWTVFPCNPKHTSDAVHQKCSSCQAGEYKYAACKPFSDTICPSCPNAREKLYKNAKEFKSGLQYCKINEKTGLSDTECSATTSKEINSEGKITLITVPRSTKCGKWMGATLPKNQDRCLPWTRRGTCGEWKSNCKADFYGQSCCYHKNPYSCGVITTRERSAKRMKYPNNDDKKLTPSKNDRPEGYPTEGYFAQFCMSLCNEFPDCLAVEIEDKGTKSNPAGTPDENDEFKKCYFKSAFTQDQRYKFKGTEPHMDCYSNTCKQNIYTMSGGKPMKIINYKIPVKKSPEERKQALLKKENEICTKECNSGDIAKRTNCKKKCLKRRMRHTKNANSKLQKVAQNAA